MQRRTWGQARVLVTHGNISSRGDLQAKEQRRLRFHPRWEMMSMTAWARTMSGRSAGDGRGMGPSPGLWEAGCLHSGRAVVGDKGRIRDMTISNYGEQASAALGAKLSTSQCAVAE